MAGGLNEHTVQSKGRYCLIDDAEVKRVEMLERMADRRSRLIRYGRLPRRVVAETIEWSHYVEDKT
jgi:ABC-type phosphate/phosphonate transport system permease subunit